MATWIRIPVLLASCLTFAATADAQQRPLVTEDPETIGTGRVLLEGGFSFDKDQTNASNGLRGDVIRFATFGVSVGLSPNAEVQIDGGLVQRFAVREQIGIVPLDIATALLADDTLTSMEDLIVATKIRLASETESRPALGMRFGTKLPTSAVDRGIGLGTTDFFASFLVGKTVQSVRTVGNVGLAVLGNPEEAHHSVAALGFGVSVARAVTNQFEVVGEVSGRLEPFVDTVPDGLESRGVFRLAGRYTHAMLRLDIGLLAGVTNRDPSFGISAGATYVITR